MELGLSLGDFPAPARPSRTLEPPSAPDGCEEEALALELGVGTGSGARGGVSDQEVAMEEGEELSLRPRLLPHVTEHTGEHLAASALLGPGVLHELPGPGLLYYPSTDMGSLPLQTGNYGSSSDVASRRGLDVNTAPADEDCEATAASPPNSSASSLHMEQRPTRRRAAEDADEERGFGGARKKLRLSKEQSAFLEESFKQHNTLNPKQKLALAKRLKLRPRQVEVWFQNRRARTKLKQTEVDCEHLKRHCETLAQENRRLQREVAELRAFRTTTPHPFYTARHPPPATATTMLSLCPSCHRATAAGSPALPDPTIAPSPMSVLFTKSRLCPFPAFHRRPSATS